MTTSEIPPGGWDRPIPEQPVYRAPLSGWWRRVWASLVDFTIISIPAMTIAVVIFGGVGIVFGADEGAGWVSLVLGTLLYIVLLMAVSILYGPMLMRRPGQRNGQTWGKQLLGIRVIRTNGAPMDVTWSAVREVGIKGVGLGCLAT